MKFWGYFSINKYENNIFSRINIDSKKNNTIRKKVFEEYNINLDKIKLEFKNNFNHKIHNASLLKGDILFKSNNINIIGDAKDYKEIDGRMKFPYKEEKKYFIKTIDSNIKYMIYFDFIINNNQCNKLFTMIFNRQNINKETFENFEFKISYYNFIELFNFFEYGVLYKKLNIKEKYVFSNLSKDINNIEEISIKKINLKKIIGEEIDVKFNILNNNYLYFNFYVKNELFYSLSHRSFKEKKGYPQGNCAFISKKYIDETILTI